MTLVDVDATSSSSSSVVVVVVAHCRTVRVERRLGVGPPKRRSDTRRYSDIRRISPQKTNPVIVVTDAHFSLASPTPARDATFDDDASTLRHARDRAVGDFGASQCAIFYLLSRACVFARGEAVTAFTARLKARSLGRMMETDDELRVRVRRVQVRAFATGAAPKAPAGKAEVTVGFMSRRARARDGSFARKASRASVGWRWMWWRTDGWCFGFASRVNIGAFATVRDQWSLCVGVVRRRGEGECVSRG